nr:jasmonate-zim-domain protein 10 [Tanacetum cinerariifolium]
MLRSPSIEYDFFRLKDESSPKKLSDRRDIQGVISKINPELLKTAIASASASACANSGFLANKSSLSPKQVQSTLPVYNQDCGNVNMAKSGAPLTIFYNGNVSVFDVSSDQAERIMKLAQSGSPGSKIACEPAVVVKAEMDQSSTANKDLPMSRKKSLRRFLEKRKERQVAKSPYAFSQANSSLH